MAGRPKIQFADDADGKRAWGLIEKIKAHHYAVANSELEQELAELRKKFPDAKISSRVKQLSAADIMLKLLEAECDRIDSIAGKAK